MADPMLQRTNNMSPSSPSAWRTPTLILVCGCIILTLSMGIRHTGGLFLQPMTGALGWNREVFSFAFAIQNLVWGLGSPFAGAFADRYGAGRVIAASALLYVVGLALMAVSSTGLALDLSAGVLVGLGLSGTTFAVIMGVIGRHTTPEKRSLALGIASAGGSFGQFAVLPIGQALISSFGWQAALFLLACGVGLIAPLAYAMADGHKHASGAGQSAGAALVEAGGQRSFHYLFWSYFVCGFQVVFIAVHMPSYLKDHGLEQGLATTSLALIGLFNIFGTYTAGLLGQRYPKRYLLSAIYALRAVTITVFLLVPLSAPSVWVFSAVMGFLWLSTVPPTNAVVLQIFGPQHLSMLGGFVFFSHQIGSFLGVWLGGKLYDATGSYDIVWLLAIALGVMAALVNLPVREQAIARQPLPA